MQNEKIDLSSLQISRDKKEQHEDRPIPWKKVLLAVSIVLIGGAAFALRGALTRLPEVELTTVSLTSSSQANSVLTASGYVVAQVKAAVASKATGRLERLYVEEGDKVRRGQSIGQLDDRDLVAALNQARANLAVSRADSNDARQTLERQNTLFARGLTSKADVDAAEARFKRVIATINSSEAAVNATEVALENTRIRAPFDGTVLTKNADVGEMVAPFGAATNSKGAVVTMADMSSLQVEADVSESNITRVKVGQPCEITLDAYPEKRYAGTVHKIVPTADRAKATVLTKVAFRERDEKVLPEMSAKVNFLSEEGERTLGSAQKLTVASGAILPKNGAWYAYTFREGILTEVQVKVGPSAGSRTEILEGLASGDQVVLNPQTSFATGTRVKVKP
jgi:RND family efflux transporter MFP subunit